MALLFFAPIAVTVGTARAAIDCGDFGKSVVIEGKEQCLASYQEDCAKQGMVPLDEEGAPQSDSGYVCCPAGSEKNSTNCFFSKYINPTIKVLTALAGIAVVAGISIGGIQYAASGGDPQKVAAGKAKVTKALFGLVGFMFLFSALQFMSPGGLSQQSKANPGPGETLAEACSSTFFGLKPWFAYMPDSKFDANCNVKEFNLLSNGNKKSDIAPVVLAIVDNLVRIAALVAVVFVVIGGVKYVTSQGEPEGVKGAKDSIINAMIGMVIAIIAASVVSFIGNQLQ